MIDTISTAPLVAFATAEVRDERRRGSNVRVLGVDTALGEAEVYLYEDALLSSFGGEVIVGLVDELAWRAGRAREEDDCAAVLGEAQQSLDVGQCGDIVHFAGSCCEWRC